MVGSSIQHHMAVTLVAIITTVTTLSVTYHLLKRSQCLTINIAPDSLTESRLRTCAVRL
ncbi:MAG: hypothetical protein WBA10_19210 [Elainellaceae cyanobacterium]